MTLDGWFPLIILSMEAALLRRQIAFPADHGSWVFILSPLLIGLFAAGNFTSASLMLFVAAMGAFLLRQPVTMFVKARSGRRPRTDQAAAGFWILVYGAVILANVSGLITRGFGFLVYLVPPALIVFVWHLWLVSLRKERRQSAVSILAAAALALSAPAAYWVGTGHYSPQGWWLWLLASIQSAASILYAYLRLEQRDWDSLPSRSERFRAGAQSLLFSGFNLAFSLAFGFGFRLLPVWIFLPYLLQFLENLWGVEHPAINWKPTRVGIRQLIISTLWTLLFIVLWRL